ncbi:MAG: hypothetical protein K2M65_01775, partial [Muribaculaceae bacterium]|nr:hypothetical protein [Muribaculaceae bacterium]
MSKNKSYHIKPLLLCMLVLPALLCGVRVHAFSDDVYTRSSVLSSGRWVKVQVSSTGRYMIPASTLRSWGFNNPANVRIHGYGGADIPDVLSLSNYVDDLPQVQTAVTDRGVVFYAVGPVNWTSPSSVRQLNSYSSEGYYFVTENDTSAVRSVAAIAPGVTSMPAQTLLTDQLLHEDDTVSPGTSGQMLFGEDFVYTRNRTFNFNLEGYTGENIDMRCVFLAKASGASLAFTVNGTALSEDSDDKLSSAANANSKSYGDLAVINKRFAITGNRLALEVNLNATSAPARAL